MKNWFKKLFESKKKKNTSLFKEVKEGNTINLYDQQTVEYLESGLTNPTQDGILKLIEKLEKIIISKRETNKEKTVMVPITINGKTTEIKRHPTENVKIIEITDTQELQAVQKHFEILNEPKGHLMCVGSYFFDFIDKQGNATQIEYLGYGHIRIQKEFKDDAELKRPLDFLNWLTSIGISEPLNNWIETKNTDKENKRRVSKWKSVAPKTLIKSMESLNQNPFGEIDQKLLDELKSEIPDEEELVLILLKLYGTGFYQWNGVPIYETIPLNVLMGVNINFLNSILEIEELDKTQKEGAARFLSSTDFFQKRKPDLKKVSKKVEKKLLVHLEEMGDKEKIREFKMSFKE